MGLRTGEKVWVGMVRAQLVKRGVRDTTYRVIFSCGRNGREHAGQLSGYRQIDSGRRQCLKTKRFEIYTRPKESHLPATSAQKGHWEFQ